MNEIADQEDVMKQPPIVKYYLVQSAEIAKDHEAFFIDKGLMEELNILVPSHGQRVAIQITPAMRELVAKNPEVASMNIWRTQYTQEQLSQLGFEFVSNKG